MAAGCHEIGAPDANRCFSFVNQTAMSDAGCAAPLSDAALADSNFAETSDDENEAVAAPMVSAESLRNSRLELMLSTASARGLAVDLIFFV